VFSTRVVCDRGSESSCGPSICYGLAYGNKNVATPYRRITAAAARHAGHVNFGPTKFTWPHLTSAANPPAAAATVDRRDKRTDEHRTVL